MYNLLVLFINSFLTFTKVQSQPLRCWKSKNLFSFIPQIKEKKKKPTGTSKEPKDHTTLRTGKILAGQKPYDGLSGFAGQLSAGTNRKSAFQSHAEYNPLESYPNSGGGVYRKPVTGYYDTGISNSGVSLFKSASRVVALLDRAAIFYPSIMYSRRNNLTRFL